MTTSRRPSWPTMRSEIGHLRLAAQRLVGPPEANATEAVRWLTAVQAQDREGALTSVALRSAARTRAEVEAALDAGRVVRSWPMRGTLHLVAAGDLPWMLSLLAERVLRASAARRTGLGLDEAQLERGRELAVAALAGGAALTRGELFDVWEDAGLSTADQRGTHILRFVALTQTVVFGPTSGGEPRLVLSSEWIREPRVLDREAALGELAERYFRGHGPATLSDFARWTGMAMTDARRGLERARAPLATLDVDGAEFLMDPETPERLAGAREEAGGILLLPGFDEFVLGYGDRSAVLDPRFAEHIVPGGNGVFRPTVIADGRVVGTWRHTGSGGRRTVSATPFQAFTASQVEGIQRAYAALP